MSGPTKPKTTRYDRLDQLATKIAPLSHPHLSHPMPNTTTLTIQITESERDAIVTALDFYYRYQRGTIEQDQYEQARLAAREFGIDRLDELATKIATLQ